MAISRYNPNAGRGGKQYQNADGPGGSTVNYGNPRGKGQDQRYQEARDQYGNSPWYGRAGDQNPMPWAGPGARAPFFTPDAGDPRNAGYFVQHESPFVADIPAAKAAAHAAYNADPAYAAAKGAGDIKGQIAAMMAMKQANQQQRFIDQGGTAETWQNRYDENNQWPVPRSPSGNYQYGPGRPGPTPPGVAQSAPPASPSGGVRRGASPGGGMPPAQNPMFQGYQPGTPSKSGMGQSPNMGAATGSGETAGMYPDMAFAPQIFQAMQGGFGMGGGYGASPFASMLSQMSRGMGGGMSGAGMGFGGIQDAMMQRFGGYRPAAPQGMMYY